ncbi:hypothetical protein [Bacillus cereus]|uniref:hypothetical protein n=1 Tax=Bacillus cereus TaxID=1396 RepID=UPI000BF6AEC2|nr:hypothetical protein [Bacillus cereus]PFQ36512.1 hypothetical protein COK33_17240 [Bacillus cereus]
MTTVKNKMTINTAKGEISAIAVNDDAYPSIKVMINGELVTVVELDSDNDNFRIHNYQGNEDEPIASYDYNPASIFDYEIVVGQTEQAIISNTNMWEECHTSLDKILKFFNLIVVDDSTYFDDYKFLVVKK